MRAYRAKNRDRINANSRESASRIRGKGGAQPRSRPTRPETPETRRDRLVAEELAAMQARRSPFPWER